MDYSMYIKIGVVIVALIVAFCSIYVFHMPVNNTVEVAAEKIIEKETGLKIDIEPTDTQSTTTNK